MSNQPIYFDFCEDGSISVCQGADAIIFACGHDFERFLEVCNTFVRQYQSNSPWPTVDMTEEEAKNHLKQ